MKWQVHNPDSRTNAWKEKHTNWTRGFAWRPITDYKSRTRYWLQFVWFKGSGRVDSWQCRERWWEGRVPRCPDYARSGADRLATFETWEIRGGSRSAPDVKECPPGKVETSV